MYQRLPTEQAAFSVFSAESKDKRGLDLISDALPFGRLLYGGPHGVSNAIGYAQHFSRSHDAVIRVYDDAANVIERTSRRASSKNDDLLLNFLPDV